MQIGDNINTHQSQFDDDQARAGNNSANISSRFNQTLKNVQGLLRGHSMSGKVFPTRRSDAADELTLPPSDIQRTQSAIEPVNTFVEEDIHNTSKQDVDGDISSLDVSISKPESASVGARATDSARVIKFKKELSGTPVILERLRELSWSGVPPYMRPKAWRLLLGYAPTNSDRRERILGRKRLEYLDCVSHFYDLPDTERSEDEITMLRQIGMDCPRTAPNVTFFQQEQVQKSLERILYTWAIRHPASGYVQGINYLVTPFLVVFLSEHIEGSIENWSIDTLSPHKNSEIEADCYWCLSTLLDGMQDHYTFAQPGIQRLVFKLKELVTRIDEPVSRHMEEQGLEFLQFSFRWFNCLLIREIPFHLVIRLWDTYLAEGDALPDFLVYIYASFLLTWSDELKKLDFLEMVMFLQHLPTENWSHHELEMVLSRAYIWHSVFNNSPHHLLS